ncbi:MAG TPA: c-type cytochrome [Terracidiphilus sp.]|nr:c-type cytochrome [Terracidiphilus sp.]
MKISSPLFIAFSSVALSLTLTAQQPVAPAPGGHAHPPSPPPTNLHVLPKDLTGDQVHEIMHKWEAALGTECSTCHAADPTRKRPDGRPMLNFPDDSKPEKATARLMVKMVEEINTQYVSKVDNSGAPVTCGTCHRGHLDPQPFVPPPDHDHDHDHPAMPH